MENGIQVVKSASGRVLIQLGNENVAVIQKRVVGYSGVFHIFDSVRHSIFSTLTESQKKECLVHIDNEFQSFKKGKGEVLVTFLKDNRGDLFKRIKKQLKIFVSEPGKGILKSWHGVKFGINAKNRKFCYVTVNKEKKEQGLKLFRKIEEAMHACLDDGYVLYGNWYKGSFIFSFYNKYNRSLSFRMIGNQYYLEIEEEERLLEELTVEEMKNSMISMLEQIKKKERLQYLFQKEEKIPKTFKDFFEGINYNNCSSLIQEIWNTLRTYYSYEELEMEAFLQLKENKRFQDKLNNNIRIGSFKNHYIAYEAETGSVFISRNKEEILEKMASFYKEKWREEMERIEKDLV